MEATVALCKCTTNKKTFGIRFEKVKDGWKYTWAFPVTDRAAGKEGYGGTSIFGELIVDSEYPGCPFCKTKSFFKCCKCGKLSCWNGNDEYASCQWCGNAGALSSGIDSIKAFENM